MINLMSLRLVIAASLATFLQGVAISRYDVISEKEYNKQLVMSKKKFTDKVLKSQAGLTLFFAIKTGDVALFDRCLFVKGANLSSGLDEETGGNILHHIVRVQGLSDKAKQYFVTQLLGRKEFTKKVVMKKNSDEYTAIDLAKKSKQMDLAKIIGFICTLKDAIQLVDVNRFRKCLPCKVVDYSRAFTHNGGTILHYLVTAKGLKDKDRGYFLDGLLDRDEFTVDVINEKNNDDKTALDLAQENDQNSLVKIIDHHLYVKGDSEDVFVFLYK